jgi:elongation factor Ts
MADGKSFHFDTTNFNEVIPAMAEISAAAVMSLRGKTGLPMMECKKALAETGGDEAAAMEWLRKQGIKTKESRIDRATDMGRIAVYTDLTAKVGAMIELMCESAPVSNSPEFRQFANDLAKQLATGPGAKTPEELLKQPSHTLEGKTLAEQKDDMFNRIREVMNVTRIVRIDAPCGAYAHHDGTAAALVEVSGGTAEAAKDVAMHVVAMKPKFVSKEDVDPAAVAKEREILTAAAKSEGKPDAIIAKMVEGRLKNFYAEQALLEQPFVKDSALTVGKLATDAKMKVVRFVHWELGK